MNKPHFTPATPRPAATVIIARDGRDGLEVFMMKRTEQVTFGGAYVFPGGSLDAADRGDHWNELLPDFSDAEASRRLALDSGGRAYWIAVIRECFEEAGLLLAYDEAGQLVDLDTAEHADLATARAALAAGELDFADFLTRRTLRPAIDRLAYFSHWITPVAAPKRFDTRFFLAAAPAAQTASHDNGENVDHVWIRPADALAQNSAGNLKLIIPTIRTLETLALHASVHDLMHHASSQQSIPVILPWRSTGRDGLRSLMPHDYAYAEVRKLDPTGQGIASYEIIPGVPVALSPVVRRITAPNPGFMTGPGTNSYLVGNRELAVIDPGPANETHVETLIREAGAPIRWIFATHTHPDHSPGAALLKARTGAQLVGMAAPPGAHQDAGFVPDIAVVAGQRIAVGGMTLRAIHTPGHASNHVCYLLEEEKLLFTGDHLMQGSTVVISPPDGDMGAYLASLRSLLAEDLDWLAPGHGYLMDKPAEMIEYLIAHRLGRENKVLKNLGGRPGATLDELLPLVYDDVPAQIHPVARQSLLAHLRKLAVDGRVTEKDGQWTLS